MDEILTIREVAEYFKLSPTTVWRWCTKGKMAAFRVGRSWRVHRSEVEKIIGQSSAGMAEVKEQKRDDNGII
jgi:excisionase family DNA binding protein